MWRPFQNPCCGGSTRCSNSNHTKKICKSFSLLWKQVWQSFHFFWRWVCLHVVARIGNMVLDLGQCVALALDTPILDDLHKSLLDRITKNPLESQKSKTSHVEDALAIADEKEIAEQWFMNFLKGKNILQLFGLRSLFDTIVMWEVTTRAFLFHGYAKNIMKKGETMAQF